MSLARVNARNEKKEIYENLEAQKKIAALYEKVIGMYENDPKLREEMKIIRIDASKSIEEVEEIISSSLL